MRTDSELPAISLAEYLARAPSNVETARRAVEPYRRLTPDERWKAFLELQREVELLLNGRSLWRDDAETLLWRHWMDSMPSRIS